MLNFESQKLYKINLANVEENKKMFEHFISYTTK